MVPSEESHVSEQESAGTLRGKVEDKEELANGWSCIPEGTRKGFQ